MLLQKIKHYFSIFNYYLKKVFIPKVLHGIMILSLFLIYTFGIGLSSLLVRLFKPRFLQDKNLVWEGPLPLDDTQRQS